MKFSKQDTVLVSRTQKEHIITECYDSIPTCTYTLDNGVRYWEYELEEMFEIEEVK